MLLKTRNINFYIYSAIEPNFSKTALQKAESQSDLSGTNAHKFNITTAKLHWLVSINSYIIHCIWVNLRIVNWQY